MLPVAQTGRSVVGDGYCASTSGARMSWRGCKGIREKREAERKRERTQQEEERGHPGQRKPAV